MKRGSIGGLGLALISLGLLGLGPSSADANRPLLSRVAVETTFCANCAPPTEGKLLNPQPPPEAQIEGPCGLAIDPGGSLYVADYYHHVIDVFPGGGSFSKQLPFQSQLHVAVANPPEGPCGLAIDSKGALYVNLWHQGVVRLKPTLQTFDKGNATGVAVDAAGNVYVDRRTYIAVYQPSGAPVEVSGEPLKIGLGKLGDGFGVAVSTFAGTAGRVYVLDAADNVVEVFDSAGKSLGSISRPGGFTSLVDTNLAVDPTNGHLLVIDNLQPGFEHPITAVVEFDVTTSFLGQLPTCPAMGDPEFETKCTQGRGPIFGESSGIAIAPTTGNLYVTDGNDEESNVFAYGPYSASLLSAPPPEPESSLTSTSAQAAPSNAVAFSAPPASPRASSAPRHHRRCAKAKSTPTRHWKRSCLSKQVHRSRAKGRDER